MPSSFRRLAILTFLALPVVSRGADYSVRTLPLPGGTPAGIGMDYIAFDKATDSVWVPAGNTGAVDVIDAMSQKIRQITGFATKEVTMRDRKRVLGPGSITFGDGTAY